MSALSPQQFGSHTTNDNETSANGQGSPAGEPSSSTTTTVTVKGSAPVIRRSS
jgi:hypothetical protein